MRRYLDKNDGGVTEWLYGSAIIVCGQKSEVIIIIGLSDDEEEEEFMTGYGEGGWWAELKGNW